MKKLFTLFSLMLFYISGMLAANMTGGEVVYLTPHNNWKSDNARFAIYVYGNSGNSWASMTKVAGETDLWTGTIPSGNWTNLIFCRMKQLE